MQVGERVLVFAAGESSASIEAYTNKYLDFLRQPRLQPDASVYMLKYKDFKDRFQAVYQKLHGQISDVTPDVKRIRAELSAVIAQDQLGWPDFEWVWDASTPLMGMFLGLVLGAAARKDVPRGLPFPPPNLAQKISKQKFFDLVSPFVINMPPRSQNPNADDGMLRKLLVETTLVKIMLLTAMYGLRFDLNGNFEISQGQITAKFLHREVVQMFPLGLLAGVGLSVTHTFAFPPNCPHGRNEFEHCEPCVQKNSDVPGISLETAGILYMLSSLLVKDASPAILKKSLPDFVLQFAIVENHRQISDVPMLRAMVLERQRATTSTRVLEQLTGEKAQPAIDRAEEYVRDFDRVDPLAPRPAPSLPSRGPPPLPPRAPPAAPPIFIPPPATPPGPPTPPASSSNAGSPAGPPP